MRVAVTNMYVGNKKRPEFRRRLAATKVAVIAASEAQRMGTVAGYHRFAAPAHRDRYARETALYVRKNVRVDGHLWRTVTNDHGGNTHARTVNMVLLRHGGHRWAPIVIHANPGRVGKARTENTRLMAEVFDLCVYAMSEGYTPLPMGDFNRRATERGTHTPYWLSLRLAGEMRLAGVDGIVAPKGVTFKAFNNRGRPPGSDHPLITANIIKE